MNIKLVVLSPTTILSIFMLIDAHMMFEFAILDVGVPKPYIPLLLQRCCVLVISKDVNKVSRRQQL